MNDEKEMSDIVIRIESLYKKFCRNLKHSMKYGLLDIGRSALGFSINRDELRKDEFWAVEDINFELCKGESIGLIGMNGSGKSTLLRLINGIFPPDRGKITINGRIGALIAVGAGFHPHMTGRENIYLNGTILGMKKKEIINKFDSIVDFADIGNFLDSPVSTYSSGMTVRLGFAIAIHVEPEILLIDEILAVGDMAFQYKCYEKIRNLKQNGTSFIFVSHNESSIRYVCENGLVMNHGRQVFKGNVDEALRIYSEITNNQLKKYVSADLGKSIDSITRRGNGKARFTEVEILDTKGNAVEKIPYGTKKIVIAARYRAIEKISMPYFSAFFRDAKKPEHVLILGASTDIVYPIDYIDGSGEIRFEIDISILGPNLYGLYMGISDSVMAGIAYDVWDINGKFLEVEESEKMTKNNIRNSRPYMISDFKFSHTRN